jgi:alpha-glucosidase (family GH31 glycosyl hydrolase)
MLLLPLNLIAQMHMMAALAAEQPVTLGLARFSVVSPSLIRLELGTPTAAAGATMTTTWDDRPTLAYPGGRSTQTDVGYNVSHLTADSVTITTDELVLHYDRSQSAGAFTNTSLSITVKDTGVLWRPGDADTGNLRGSRLDIGCYDTFEGCYSNGLSPGPLSRDGWALMDDTTGVRMQSHDDATVGFPWFDSSHPCDKQGICGPTRSDWYFFGHGHRYKDAMADFALVSGKAALPPRVALGVWWSTWYNFTSYELTHTILEQYQRHGLPLDVVVMDMEWHTVDAPRFHPSMTNCTGWGGYSWNEQLIPDPLGFQAFLHSSDNPLGHPLATSLNGHSQSGIGPCQANYTAFARAIGADPADQANLHCDMSNATWVKALFDTMLDPKRIDYWWTDYTGCAAPTPGTIALPASSGCPVAKKTMQKTTELLWSNMIYDSWISKTGRRPLVLSRYGGIGNQRYGIGFSGDTESTWSTLRYQVEMTSTAANVLQAYWSHDIGGYNVYCPADPHTITPCPCGHVVVHCNITEGTCKRADGELYTRWLQFGALSPIMRTHCSHCDRRIWVYPQHQFLAMKAAFVFRNALGPYLYTQARYAYDHAVATVHPMYYDYDLPESYSYAHSQYMLGEALMAAPITHSANNVSATPSNCAAQKAIGCVDAHWSNRGLFATDLGNFDDETLSSCASRCGALHYLYMGVGWGGSGHGSNCLCGNHAPDPERILHNDPECTAHACSGNATQRCGGNWRTQVYSVHCAAQPPAPPSTKTVWIPPGDWLTFTSNASTLIHGGDKGILLTGLSYELDEIPLFARAGAVVPTQTMAQQAGPLVWIIFPGANGSGTNYEDDGNTTAYKQNHAYEYSWSTLRQFVAVHRTQITITHGTPCRSARCQEAATRSQIIQLRRLPNTPQPKKVSCNGGWLPKIAPPSPPTAGHGAGSKVSAGWWVVPASEGTLWQAGGSIMCQLPIGCADVAIEWH